MYKRQVEGRLDGVVIQQLFLGLARFHRRFVISLGILVRLLLRVESVVAGHPGFKQLLLPTQFNRIEVV